MKCKHCKYNKVAMCSTGQISDKQLHEYNTNLLNGLPVVDIGCGGGKPEDTAVTKADILEQMQKAIDKYNDKNMFVDCLLWKQIQNDIAEYLI